MKIAINEDDYGRVVRTPGAFNVYKIDLVWRSPLGREWDNNVPFVLNRENALRLQEGIRLWLKEHPV